MSKLALVEFARHNEVVWSYLRLMLEKVSHIDVYVSEFVYNQLYDFHKNKELTWIIKNDLQTVEEFVDMHRIRLMSVDRILFTSVPPKELKIFSDKSLASKSCLLIHDLHYYFSEFDSIDEEKNVLKMLKGQLLQERRYIESSFKNIDQIVVASKDLYDYAQEKGWYRVDGYLDLLVSLRIKQKVPKKKIRIVIPGSVSVDRKNYQLVFDALLELNQQALTQKIKITFLGELENRQTQRKIKQFAKRLNSHIEIEWFPSFVPQKNFDKIIKKAHFLILPIANKKSAGSIHEQYGKSTISGSISDMVKFGKPALIPSFYPLPDIIEEVVTRYHDEKDLAATLKDWIHYRSFLDKPINTFKAFKADVKVDKFFNTLHSLEECS